MRARRPGHGAVSVLAAVRLSIGLLIFVALVPACSSAPPAAKHVSVTVQPGGTSAADQAVHIRVAGLTAGEVATLQVTSTDAEGAKWVSSASYHANASGVIDPDQTAAVAGSYQGVSGMGPIWSMRTTGPVPFGAYAWAGPSALYGFTVKVSVKGVKVASTSFERVLSGTALVTQSETLHANGFVADFAYPAAAARRPAILVLGGSEGGLPSPLLVDMLASQGYPALGLAYFGEPGLSSTLSRIPLEYFARALRWLAVQPVVNPAKIAVLGISRGSEAAQLLGVHYPSLVHAVIASVPSDAANCSYPGCHGPAWTLNGHALPFTFQEGHPNPIDDPAAVFPDQQIQGPIFLDCAEADQTWPSCPYAQAILSRLDAHHDPWPHVLYAYPDTGHIIGSFVPYEPSGPTALSAAWSSYTADQEAAPVLWQHLLSFLAGFAAAASP